jgi:REP element-mobilizing transposase RayT
MATVQLEPGCFYHIYNHANGSDNLFREEENYYYFLRKWKKYIHPIADTVAYCLMPNHFHWLVKVKDRELLVLEMVRRRKLKNTILQNLRGLSDKHSKAEIINYFSTIDISTLNLEGLEDDISTYLSQQFSNLFNGYTKAINKRYKRYGSLFAPRFRRKLVDSSEYLRQLIIYIHTNPIHHGFSENLLEWEFSSFNDICSGEVNLFKFPELADLFENQEEMIKSHNSKVLDLLNEEYTFE